MADLYELGYDTGQISQIYKIKKLGINIEKQINTGVSTEQLRTLHTMLSDDKYTKKNKNTIIKFYLEKNKDVRYLIDKGFELACQIHIAMEAEAEGISIEPMANKGYDFLQMKDIYKYLKKGIDITKFIDNNIPIEEGVILQKNKINCDEIFENYSKEKIKMICHWLKKDINVVPHIKPKYSKYQIDSIGKALSKKVDVKKVKTNDLPGSVMDIIIEGLVVDVDITPYLTKSTSTQRARVMFDCLKNGADIKTVLKYEDPKIAKLALKLSSFGIDDSFLSKEKDHERLRFLTQVAIDAKSCSDIDFNRIVNASTISQTQLKKAIALMKEKRNVDSLFICSFDAATLKRVTCAIENGIDISPFLTSTTDTIETNALITLLERNYTILRKE